MGIRSSISTTATVVKPKVNVPWELTWSLALVNGGYAYGQANTTVDNLLGEAERWDKASSAAIEHGQAVYARLCSKHSAAYVRAAELLDEFERKRR